MEAEPFLGEAGLPEYSQSRESGPIRGIGVGREFEAPHLGIIAHITSDPFELSLGNGAPIPLELAVSIDAQSVDGGSLPRVFHRQGRWKIDGEDMLCSAVEGGQGGQKAQDKEQDGQARSTGQGGPVIEAGRTAPPEQRRTGRVRRCGSAHCR